MHEGGAYELCGVAYSGEKGWAGDLVTRRITWTIEVLINSSSKHFLANVFVTDY